ncbi:MAG: sensor histidine kinase [Flammeovirgaceae bacterium]
MLIGILIFIVLVPCANAQISTLSFKHLSIQHGLSEATVNCIIQDKMGFLWIGTDDGLNRFDGYNFVVYRTSESENGISNKAITSLLEDSKGFIWIGTHKGLNRLDPRTGKITQFYHNPSISSSIPNDYIVVLMEDERGTIWIGTDGGLCRYHGNDIFERYLASMTNPDALENSSIASLFLDSQKRFWVGTWGGGIHLMNRETGIFRRFPHKNPQIPHATIGSNVISIVEHKGKIWVGTRDGGMDVIDAQKGSVQKYFHQQENPNSLSDNRVIQIFPENDTCFWIATHRGGLNRFNPLKGIFEHFKHDDIDPYSLSSDDVQCIFKDKNQIIYIGTRNGGINIIDEKAKKFTTYQPIRNKPYGLQGNMVWAIYEDSEGEWWIGTNRGLNRLNRYTGECKLYENQPNNPFSLSNNSVNAIIEDSLGRIWVGTWDGGLSIFNKKSEKFERFNTSNNSSIKSNKIKVLFKDSKGKIWIGFYEGGLGWFDDKNKKFFHYKHNINDVHSISNDIVWGIKEDKKGNLWIATDRGLNKFDQNTGKFQNFLHIPQNTKTISDNTVWAIHIAKNGHLWASTRDGLNRFIEENGTFVRYTDTYGFKSDNIFGILEDQQGRLWLSTSKGIAKFTPPTDKEKPEIKNYDFNDGLQSNQFNIGSYFQNSKGEMFFGGIHGFNVFFPDSIKDNDFIPPVVFTDFQIFNKTVPIATPDSPLKEAIEFTHSIQLSYQQSVISFSFSALSYRFPEKNEYAYKMEGFDKEWNYIGNKRTATYTNLDPGNYTFRVKAANNDGVWNEEGNFIHLEIIPPFWHTWWFRTLIIIILFILILSIYTWRVSEIKRQKRLLEVQVWRRTEELRAEKQMVENQKKQIELQNLQMQEQQDEILTQNQELIQYKDEILAQRDQIEERNKKLIAQNNLLIEKQNELEKAQDIIKKQMSELQKINLELEDKVKERTIALEKTYQELLRAHEQLDNFAYRSAHDLRGPIMRLLGLCYAASLELKDKDMVAIYYLEKFEHTIRDMELKLSNLMDALEIIGRDVKIKDVKINPMIDEVLDHLKHIFDTSNFQFHLNIPPETHWMTDEEFFRVILTNLLDNSISYRDKRKPVNHVYLNVHIENDCLILNIKDNGIGIENSAKPKIFDMFYVANLEAKGFGLGLYEAKMIVEKLKGSVRLKENPEGLTEFEVILPMISSKLPLY